MTKQKLNGLMKHRCIVPSELEDVIIFVSDLLYERRKELEVNEPYATKTIDILSKAEYEVFDLINYIDELEDDTTIQNDYKGEM